MTTIGESDNEFEYGKDYDKRLRKLTLFSNPRIRDELFTSPFPHPSYVVLDNKLAVRDKFVGELTRASESESERNETKRNEN